MQNNRILKITVILLLFATYVVIANGNPSEPKSLKMPDDVKAIIDKSCFGCHNNDSKNDKAKEKLNLSTFDSLAKNKMIASYRKMAEAVEENEMPPAKFIERFPDKKLTDEEKQLLMNWAKNEAKALMK